MPPPCFLSAGGAEEPDPGAKALDVNTAARSFIRLRSAFAPRPRSMCRYAVPVTCWWEWAVSRKTSWVTWFETFGVYRRCHALFSTKPSKPLRLIGKFCRARLTQGTHVAGYGCHKVTEVACGVKLV